MTNGIQAAIQAKIDNLNKPKGSLGRLEELAMQICLIQQTLAPRLTHPCHLLLGGDHGIEREGVSVSPREVTWQQMINFTRGGGGVNMFCRQHGFDLSIVDVGVDYDLSQVPGIINRKVARGTRNFLYEPAMTDDEYWQAIGVGADLVDDCAAEGLQHREHRRDGHRQHVAVEHLDAPLLQHSPRGVHRCRLRTQQRRHPP